VNAEELQEELASFVQALVDDDRLYASFAQLKTLAEEPRRAELTKIVNGMRVAGEDRELIGATQSLTQPQIFQGVWNAVEELRGDRET
jgi:hypothetical protein